MMRIPLTLSGYISKQFLYSTLIALGVVMAVIGLIDIVELIRRTSNKDGVPFHVVMEMAFLKLPYMAERITPYAVMIGGIMALTKLTRTQELVVARAAGISVWQFMAPLVILALVLGSFMIAVFNPVSSAMLSRFEQLEGKYISGRPSVLTVSSSGLWLRQVESGATVMNKLSVEEYILHAERISQYDMVFSNVTIFAYGDDSNFIGRIDAEKAKLEVGYWSLENATISIPGLLPKKHALYRLSTNLKITEIQDSFAEPRTLSFWQLSSFIKTLEDAGFDALRHKIHWHATLASPLMLCGMVFLAAVFSLRLPRRGKISLMIGGALVTGFVMNFVVSLFHAFGYSGSLPILLAAWSPPAIAIMAGLALLLHLEDG